MRARARANSSLGSKFLRDDGGDGTNLGKGGTALSTWRLILPTYAYDCSRSLLGAVIRGSRVHTMRGLFPRDRVTHAKFVANDDDDDEQNAQEHKGPFACAHTAREIM